MTHPTDDPATGTAPTPDAHGTDRVRARRLSMAEPNGFWSLVPRRDLVRVAVLTLVLVAILGLQRGAGPLVKRLTEAVVGPAPAAVPPRTEAPRVKLARPEKAP